MLTVPRLDDLDYEKMVSHARAMIPTMVSGWTDLNDHDPGMTTLQAFAWLCDSLNYYINATGEAHRLNFLKLLGITPRRAAARCRVAFSALSGSDIRLTRGQRLWAGDTVFELTDSVRMKANELTVLYGEEDGNLFNLTAFAGADSTYAPVLTDNPAKSVYAYFGFECPLPEELKLFVEVAENSRNRFDDTFTLVNLAWECFDGAEWREVSVVQDETCGLLRSGFITFKIGSSGVFAREGMKPAYYLRCHVREGVYDLRPRVGCVTPNCAVAVQTDTQAQGLELLYDGSGVLPIDYALGEDDLISVAVAEGEFWREWYRHYPAPTDLCALERDGQSGLYRVAFDETRFGQAPGQGARVLVSVIRGGAPETLRLGVTDGCALQRFELDTANLYEIRLALSRVDTDGRRVLWLYDECADLSLAGYDDKVFACLAHEGCVVFGDSLCGVQPQAGLTAEAVTLKRYQADEGCVMRGQLNHMQDGSEGILSLSNLENAFGGERMRTSEELEPLLEEKMSAVTRAVTLQDIKNLVLATPGLLIDSVAVIPMRDYCNATGAAYESNTVLIAVKPKSANRLPELDKRYRSIITKNLEQYRLITINLRVIPARYVGISVYGRIALTEGNQTARQQVLDEIARLVDGASVGAFGRCVDFGKLFSSLEMHPCVKAVAQLSLEYSGAGGGKNGHGDIVLHPDSLAYLKETGIEFI